MVKKNCKACIAFNNKPKHLCASHAVIDAKKINKKCGFLGRMLLKIVHPHIAPVSVTDIVWSLFKTPTIIQHLKSLEEP